MLENFTIEFYDGDRFVGEAYEPNLSWITLIMLLGIRKKDGEYNIGKKGLWNNVTVWTWNPKTEKNELLRSGMEI